MGNILYNEKTILEAKSNIEICNEAIIDAMDKINNELLIMNQTLNTPKSNKELELYKEYLNEKLIYVRRKREDYNNTLSIITTGYCDYLNNVNKTVGDTSE